MAGGSRHSRGRLDGEGVTEGKVKERRAIGVPLRHKEED
jgi:hypothetical protein